MIPMYHEKNTHGTPAFPLEVYSHPDRDGVFFVSQHWHEELEWIYVEEGMLNLTVGGQTLTLRPGEFSFVNSGELHEIRSLCPSLHHAIVFNPEFLDFSLYDDCQSRFIGPITGKSLLFPASAPGLSAQVSQAVASHLSEIVRLYHTRPSLAPLSIKLHILHILEILFETKCFLENTSSSRDEDSINRLKKVIEYIHGHYGEAIPLQSLADICCVSPNYFCRYFKENIGKTPVSFLNDYRIQKACQMLTESELPISQIALLTGFDNFSYFIRKFREYKGVTPGQYRNASYGPGETGC